MTEDWNEKNITKKTEHFYFVGWFYNLCFFQSTNLRFSNDYYTLGKSKIKERFSKRLQIKKCCE